jgi:hypothetical protein
MTIIYLIHFLYFIHLEIFYLMKLILCEKKEFNNRIRNIYIDIETSIKYIKHKRKFIKFLSYLKRRNNTKGGKYTPKINFNDMQNNILHFLLNGSKPFTGSQKFHIVSENNENVLKNIRPDRNPFPEYVAHLSYLNSYIKKYTSEILIPLQYSDKNIENVMHNAFTYVITQCEIMIKNIANMYFNDTKPLIVLKNKYNDIFQYMFVNQGYITYIIAKPSKNKNYYTYNINAFICRHNKYLDIEKDFDNPPGIWTVQHNYTKLYYDYIIKNRLQNVSKSVSKFDISALDQGVVEKIFSHIYSSLEIGKKYTNKQLTSKFIK